ncbi:MAG: glycosyltransferase family 4 protein [Marinilabiliales bacterium]
MTDPLGQSQILPYLINLSKESFYIRIISFEKPALYTQKATAINELISNYKISWLPLYYTKRPPVISTLIDIFKLKKVVIKEIKKNKPGIIHCRSYIPSIIALKQCRKHQIKFLFDMRGFYADERVEGKIWNLNNPVYRLIYNYFKKKERQFLHNSDSVISLTQAAKSFILKRENLYIDDNKISVIPCCADFEHFKPRGDNIRKENREKLKIGKNTFVLTYLGSLGTWYLVEEMLMFFKLLKEKNADSLFLIISYQQISNYKMYYTDLGLKDSDFINIKVDRNSLPEILSVTDFGISFIKPSFSKMASSPTKVGEMLAMGIPIVVNKNVGDMDLVFSDPNIGFVVDTDNPHTYNNIIDKIFNKNKFNPELIRSIAYNYYDLDNVGIAKYKSIYNKLILKS